MGPLLNGAIGPLAWKNLTLVNLLKQARARAGQIDGIPPAGRRTVPHPVARRRALGVVGVARSQELQEPVEQPAAEGRPVTDLLAEPQYFLRTTARWRSCWCGRSRTRARSRRSLASVNGASANRRGATPRIRGLADRPDRAAGARNRRDGSSQDDTNRAGWLALAGVALLYLVVYRGFGYPLLDRGHAAGRHALVDGLADADGRPSEHPLGHFAVMLIGMGDYGVLWVTRYEGSAGRGPTVAEAARATAIAVRPGHPDGGVTTALAFFAAMLADFQAVAELGWIAGSGVLLCAWPFHRAAGTQRASIAAAHWPWPSSRLQANDIVRANRNPQSAWLPAFTAAPAGCSLPVFGLCRRRRSAHCGCVTITICSICNRPSWIRCAGSTS